MLTANRTPAVLADPKLFDVGIQEINTVLGTSLTWLTTAYGACERLSDTVEDNPFIYPAIYAGGALPNPYLPLFPDQHLGNYSFFYLADRIEWEKMGNGMRGKVKFGLIFWFRFDQVFLSPLNPDEHNDRNV